MMSAWPSFVWFVLCLLLLAEYRALSGRATVGFSRILLFFSLGAAGAGVVSIVFQRLAIGIWNETTVSWGYGPAIEEVLKALPVLLVAYVFAERRRLTIADYTILAFATGLGFSFTESNFGVVASGNVPTSAHWWLPTVGGPFGITGSMHWTAGHAIWTGVVGLGVGLGIRLWPRSTLRFVPAAVGLALALFEHAVHNWKGTHIDSFFGVIQSIARMPGWIEALYSVDLHGRLSMMVLPVVLVTALVAEGIWCRRAAKVPPDLMLPDEGLQPLVPMEWIALYRAATRGRHELVRTARYLRRRRELLLAIAELRREPESEELRGSVVFLRDRVAHERDELTIPLPNRWLPMPGAVQFSASSAVRRYWPLLLSLSLVVVRFGIAPHALGGHISTRAFALAMILMAAAFLAWRLRLFRRLPRPQLLSADGEALVNYHTRALLLGTSAVSLSLSILAWFMTRHAIVPGADQFMLSAFGGWASGAGADSAGPAGLAAVASIAAASLADPTPPDTCGPLQSEASAASERIGALSSAPRWIA
jgi:hypothetical protein